MGLLRFTTVWTVWFQAVRQSPFNFLSGAIVFVLMGAFNHLLHLDSAINSFLPSSISAGERVVGIAFLFILIYGLGYFFGRINDQLNSQPYDISFFSGMVVIGMPLEWFFVHSDPLLIALLVAIPQIYVYTAGSLDGSKRSQFLYNNTKPITD